jgi:hypothetical protein
MHQESYGIPTERHATVVQYAGEFCQKGVMSVFACDCDAQCLTFKIVRYENFGSKGGVQFRLQSHFRGLRSLLVRVHLDLRLLNKNPDSPGWSISFHYALTSDGYCCSARPVSGWIRSSSPRSVDLEKTLNPVQGAPWDVCHQKPAVGPSVSRKLYVGRLFRRLRRRRFLALTCGNG